MVPSRLDDPVKVRDEALRRHVESAAELEQYGESRVTRAAFDLRHVLEADSGALGDIGLCEPALVTQLTDTSPKHEADALGACVVQHGRIVRTPED